MLGLVDDSGKRAYVSGPAGLPRATPREAAPQPFRYGGAMHGPTGLYQMGARYPINNSDPTGLFSFSDLLDEGLDEGSDAFGVVTG
ncbi:hypothetical protein [Streptomyces akebiae]|uniref:Uncharacterized protein n=1 Tax=Streptomyces akebiae TaxID=2865673 RepID=A0ABX8Y3F9_9ACTN|nr:hypothetical protein [Streptomyces akebiae]QYX82642.1 hypothetical protein K1J60_44295 [Streptomyces akebiae]